MDKETQRRNRKERKPYVWMFGHFTKLTVGDISSKKRLIAGTVVDAVPVAYDGIQHSKPSYIGTILAKVI